MSNKSLYYHSLNPTGNGPRALNYQWIYTNIHNCWNISPESLSIYSHSHCYRNLNQQPKTITISENTSSRSYQIDLLRNNNWMPWKWRILAILRDQGLEKYVLKDAAPPSLSQPPMSQETSAAEEWKNGDMKARTRNRTVDQRCWNDPLNWHKYGKANVGSVSHGKRT